MRLSPLLLGAVAAVALLAASTSLAPERAAFLLGTGQAFDRNGAVPSFARHQQLHSKDWDEARWSSGHRRNVGLGRVDADSVKGIWHTGDEAWEGIDKVFPTDTPYAYEEDHVDKGEPAKWKSFIGHCAKKMRLMEMDLMKAGQAGGQGAAIQRLTSVLEAGKKALAKIQAEVRDKAAVNQLRQVRVASSGRGSRGSGLRAHYLSARSARNDIVSYFDGIQSATEKENVANSRASGESDAAPLPLHELRAVPARHSLTAEAFASEFASKLAEAIEDKGGSDVASRSDSCQLCVKIFGCEDCCEPVCKKEAPTTSAKVASARGANPNGDASAKAFAKKAAEMKEELDSMQETMSKTLSSVSAQPKASLSRMPCECKTGDCKNCPGDEGARHMFEEKLARARRALREAERAVAKTNDILVERVAALDATNELAIRQGLGAYGPESDEEVWPGREPTPGKSEQVGSGASDVIRGLMKEVGVAQQKSMALRLRLEEAERAAQHGAEVTAEQRHLIRELSEQLDEQSRTEDKIDRYDAAGLGRYGGERAEQLATTSVLPFYEQPGKGGRGVRAAVQFFERHPNEVRADIGGHPILSRD